MSTLYTPTMDGVKKKHANIFERAIKKFHLIKSPSGSSESFYQKIKNEEPIQQFKERTRRYFFNITNGGMRLIEHITECSLPASNAWRRHFR